jgi:hypothetical protein
MAVITPVESVANSDIATKAVIWETIGQADTCTAVQLGAWADRSVQVAGDFSGSASIAIQGSNDGSNYILLTDTQGDDLTFTAAGLKSIGPIPRYIKPVLSSGDGSADIDVILHMVGQR